MSRRRSTTRIRKGVYVRQNHRRRVSVPTGLGTAITVALVLLAVWLGAKGGLTSPAAHTTVPAKHGTPSASRSYTRH